MSRASLFEMAKISSIELAICKSAVNKISFKHEITVEYNFSYKVSSVAHKKYKFVHKYRGARFQLYL